MAEVMAKTVGGHLPGRQAAGTPAGVSTTGPKDFSLQTWAPCLAAGLAEWDSDGCPHREGVGDPSSTQVLPGQTGGEQSTLRQVQLCKAQKNFHNSPPQVHRYLHTGLKSSFEHQKPMTSHCYPPCGTHSLAFCIILHTPSFRNTLPASHFSRPLSGPGLSAEILNLSFRILTILSMDTLLRKKKCTQNSRCNSGPRSVPRAFLGCPHVS